MTASCTTMRIAASRTVESSGMLRIGGLTKKEMTTRIAEPAPRMSAWQGLKWLGT